MKKIFITLLVLACAGCVNSDFTVNDPVSPSNERYDDPEAFMSRGFALTDQIKSQKMLLII
ncbi:hypothetical protein A2336_02870 [Candidatus Peregrinibacteria bacterium RIFOXYB2_FULL_41_88]|nr:MAG: hypothetical protein A2336_02870 [Candidatus Peregrinibacteria bacterium RIFOXYB2_FULL_41_88]